MLRALPRQNNMAPGGNEGAVTVIVSLVLSIWAGGLAYEDWRWRRLPNVLLLCGVLLGAMHWLAFGLMPFGCVLTDALLAGLLGLVLFLPFYATGWMGAGDVKLISVIGWLGGLKVLFVVIVYGSVLAGMLAALLLSPVCRDYMSGRQIDSRLRARIPFGAGLAVVVIGLVLGWLDAEAVLSWWPEMAHA